jgi:hypothetical protein
VEVTTSEPPSAEPAKPSGSPPAASDAPAARLGAVAPGKRTLIGIAAPVVAPRSEPPDPGKTPPEPFASRRPPPSPPPPPPEETKFESAPPPEATTARAKRALVATRKETPEALAAAKKEARARASAVPSEAPEKSSRLGPIVLMVLVAGAALWFVLGNQRGGEQPQSEGELNPDPQAERSQPEPSPEAPVAAPAPPPEPTPSAVATPPNTEPLASATPTASAVASAAPAPSAGAPEPKNAEGSENEAPKEEPPADAKAAPGTRVVTVHLSPPDARLYYKGKSVGKPPVRIELGPDEKKRSFEAGGPGYVTRRVVIDGSQPELWIGLRPDPNAPAR